MAKELDHFISNFGKTKAALMKAQAAADIAHNELLDACIDNREKRFLKIDETAIKRYMGMQTWQQFPDS